MDVSDPTRAVAPTLDGAVLAVLAMAGKPLTVGEVAALAVRGSEIGVRRCLARLVEQGIVRATLMGRNQVHELNRDHIAAGIAVQLADLRTELWTRFRAELRSWKPRPVYAAVFGSTARGDGDESSDIDLLLVHQPFPGEKAVRTRPGIVASLAPALEDAMSVRLSAKQAEDWHENSGRLRDRVRAWTGNELQIVELSLHEWRRPPSGHLALLADVRRDGVELIRAAGLPMPALVVGNA